MQVPGAKDFLVKKAYEVAYAAFRISRHREAAIADCLQRWGLGMLEGAATADIGKLSRSCRVVEYILRIGSDTGVLPSSSSETVIREIGKIYSAITEYGKEDITADVDVRDIFSRGDTYKAEPRGKKSGGKMESGERAISVNRQEQNVSKLDSEDRVDSKADSGFAARKSAILERIRQCDNDCRMGDIVGGLPMVSERTLRYDLQELVSLGEIEKFGTGPFTRYRIKAIGGGTDLPIATGGGSVDGNLSSTVSL